MNDETYEDNVDDDNNNNNNNNALQFYHTIIWSILVDYILDSHILCLFFFFLFLLTYYTTSTKWRTTTTTTTIIINNIINTTPHGRAITIIINWLSTKFICFINMSSDSFSSTWSLSWLIADRKKMSMSSIWNCYSFFAYRSLQKVCVLQVYVYSSLPIRL